MKVCVKAKVEDDTVVVDVTSDDAYGHLVGVATFVWKYIYMLNFRGMIME